MFPKSPLPTFPFIDVGVNPPPNRQPGAVDGSATIINISADIIAVRASAFDQPRVDLPGAGTLPLAVLRYFAFSVSDVAVNRFNVPVVDVSESRTSSDNVSRRKSVNDVFPTVPLSLSPYLSLTLFQNDVPAVRRREARIHLPTWIVRPTD